MRLSYEELKDLFSYNQLTGILTWNASVQYHKLGGELAGSPNGLYWYVTINGKKYKRSRIAWFIVTGEVPIEIDHIDGNRLNDCFFNLRNVTRRENMINQKIHREGKLPGYFYVKSRNRYQAEIKINNKKVFIGWFKTAEEANKAYKEKVS